MSHTPRPISPSPPCVVHLPLHHYESGTRRRKHGWSGAKIFRTRQDFRRSSLVTPSLRQSKWRHRGSGSWYGSSPTHESFPNNHWQSEHRRLTVREPLWSSFVYFFSEFRTLHKPPNIQGPCTILRSSGPSTGVFLQGREGTPTRVGGLFCLSVHCRTSGKDKSVPVLKVVTHT